MALWRGRKVDISPLSGGLTNENYLVEVDGERYVMRLPGQSTDLLSIDRENEVHNTKAAAETGIEEARRALRELSRIEGKAKAIAKGADEIQGLVSFQIRRASAALDQAAGGIVAELEQAS